MRQIYLDQVRLKSLTSNKIPHLQVHAADLAQQGLTTCYKFAGPTTNSPHSDTCANFWLSADLVKNQS